jgi:hypothetical protein
MRIGHAIRKESTIWHLTISARHFQASLTCAGEMATQGGEVDDEADGLADDEVEGWCSVLPERDRDCG